MIVLDLQRKEMNECVRRCKEKAKEEWKIMLWLLSSGRIEADGRSGLEKCTEVEEKTLEEEKYISENTRHVGKFTRCVMGLNWVQKNT